jgi:hypothetical protein
VWDRQVLRDFRVPEGRTSEDIDAAGDGEVLAVLDLRPDEALAEAGVAREVGTPTGDTCLHPSVSPRDGEH